MPVVSVVVPVRNGERYLADCLRSIIAQTLTDLEILVVDDGSTDSSAAIVKEFASSDPRVRLLPGPGQRSAGAARNVGLSAASGDYLAFLDSDDRFSATLLQELHARAVADEADIVATRFRTIDERTGEVAPVEWGLRLKHFPRWTPVSPDDLGDWLFLAVSPAPWNKLFRAAFIAETGLQFQHLQRTNDLYFSVLAMAQARNISYITSYGIDYRVGHASSLQATLHESPLDFVEALSAVERRLTELGRWADLERAFVNLALEVSLTALRKAGTAAAFTLVHQALCGDILGRFGIRGRPEHFFLRPGYAAEVEAIEQCSSLELLFQRKQRSQQEAASARAETRFALLSLAGSVAAAAPGSSLPAVGQPSSSSSTNLQGTVGGRAPEESARPDVSVVVPVRNTETYLRDCLESVRSQRGVRFEVICVDDGSTDASPALLQRMARTDGRITVLTLPHRGQSAARNAALERAAGRYVCFLDSDDFWRMDALADLVARADRDDLDLLAFDAESVREPGVTERLWLRMATYYHRPGLYDEVVSGPTLVARMKAREHYRASPCLYVVRRTLLHERGIRFRAGISHEDNLFTFQVMLAAARAAHVPTPFYGRRIRPDSIMGRADRLIAARGYFVCAVEMLRLVRTGEFEDEVAEQMGAVVHRVFQQARNQAVRLSPDVLAELRRIDPAPDAQALHRLLVEAHAEHRSRRPPQQPPPASAPPIWHRLVGGVPGRLRHVGRRLLAAGRRSMPRARP